MMTKITEMSFFRKVITSVKDFERYAEIGTQRVITTLKYLLKLIVIFTLIVVLAITCKSFNMLNDTKQYIEKELPNFSFEENELKVESKEPIIIQKDNLLFGTFIVDANEVDDVKIQSYKSMLNDNKTGILFLKDKVIVLANPQLEVMEYEYKKLAENGEALTKQNILDCFTGGALVSILIGVFIINFIYSFMTYMIGILMYIVLLTVLGYFTAVIMKMRMKIYAVFNMTVHAFTLPTILFLIYIIINMFTGFEIIYFDAMYIGVAYIYIITAILMIKSDLIKRQQELVKIMEEQQKVAEEQKSKEDEEKKQKEKDDNDKKQKKKENGDTEEKEENELGKSDPEPQGNMFNGQ